MKEQKSFLVYGDIEPVIDELSDEQAGQLFRGMVKYFKTGETPDFTGVLKFVFIPIQQQMDRDLEKYAEKCEKNRKKIKDYWDGVKANTNVYNGIPMYSTATNKDTDTDKDTDTKTDKDTDTTTDTDTDTDTDTNTNTNAVVVVSDDNGSFYTDIWKSITPQDVDRIYEAFPDSGGDLIQAVHDDVKRKRKQIKRPVPYILGYAKRVGWDDKAEHFEEVAP